MKGQVLLFFIVGLLVTLVSGGSLGSLDVALITGAGITLFGSLAGTIGENIYLSMTTMKRGTVPQVLSSLFYPLNPDDPNYTNGVPTNTNIDLTGADGETVTMTSVMLYFFSLSSMRNFNGEPKDLDSQPLFPWGPIYSYQHPVVTVSQIRSWIARQESKVLSIPLEKVALYDLYPLAVIRKYIEIRGRRKGYSGKSTLTAFQRKYYCPNCEIKPFLRDFFQGRCFSKERCKGVGNPNVVYCEPGWKIHSESTTLPPEESNNENVVNLERIPSSIEYLGNIYEYIELQKYELSSEALEKLSPNLLLSPEGLFGLSVVLYERQLQYLLGNVERSNYKENSFKKWFRDFKQKIFRFLDFGRQTYGGENKKKPMTRAAWKQYPDSLWKKSPLKTWVHSVEKTRYCTLTNIKYNTRKWNEMDYVIAAIYYYFIRWQGIPQVYGQFVIEKNNLEKLSRATQRLVNSTAVDTNLEPSMTSTSTRTPDEMFSTQSDDGYEQGGFSTSNVHDTLVFTAKTSSSGVSEEKRQTRDRREEHYENKVLDVNNGGGSDPESDDQVEFKSSRILAFKGRGSGIKTVVTE
ncbi:putative signal peptide and transmembrane domain-containing protein [Cryptosporidium canis]|uniref:Signal peptide and transmembrane domain-containing protein n=1 Tax=Cryptosporidium canis TaxID=195482 RepID=A0ABQ8P7H2_9CRYT|nr:putative signal peptide and transmembrane domain-containing protein [Cryptosporidium canis]KAJ1615089.1 putative signal peptide and transmembrane domain-containing protein [Cryptosporidium canis]